MIEYPKKTELHHSCATAGTFIFNLPYRVPEAAFLPTFDVRIFHNDCHFLGVNLIYFCILELKFSICCIFPKTCMNSEKSCLSHCFRFL